MFRVIVRVVRVVGGAASRGELSGASRDTESVAGGAGMGEVIVGEPCGCGGSELAASCRGVSWWRVAVGRGVGLVGVRVVTEGRVFVRVGAPAARV